MDIAQRELGIPAVLEPEYLASPWLDELSGMTYLSYFMKPGSPGFHATLRWVNSRLERPVNNFTVRLMYPRPWLLAATTKEKSY
jgi:filamin